MNLRLLPLLLLALASTAGADPGDKNRESRRAEARGHTEAAHRAQGASLAESARRVTRETGGQVLSAERVPFDGRDMNRIKVVDSTGRVRVITEDPRGRKPRGRDDD